MDETKLRDEDRFCPHRAGDVLVNVKPTNFCRLGEVVVVEQLNRRYAGDSGHYWVQLFGKPGHYAWHSFRRATAQEIAAALAGAPSPLPPMGTESGGR